MLRAVLLNETAYKVYRGMGYATSWYFMYLGLESDGNSSIGFFTSLTGLALWVPMLCVSALCLNSDQHVDETVLTVLTMSSFFVSVLAGPIAFRFDSKKLGLVTVGGAYCYLCSVLMGVPSLLKAIGALFDDDLFGVGIAASTVMNAGLIALKWKNVDISRFGMFVGPSCMFGCIGLYSSLFCYSFELSYYYRPRFSDYWHRQCTMVTALLIGMGLGNALNLPAMSSTAFVFSGLYAMEKAIVIKRRIRPKSNAVFSVFGASVATWRLALYLHKNPQLLTNTIKFE